jgi:hypothetical protein
MNMIIFCEIFLLQSRNFDYFRGSFFFDIECGVLLLENHNFALFLLMYNLFFFNSCLVFLFLGNQLDEVAAVVGTYSLFLHDYKSI